MKFKHDIVIEENTITFDLDFFFNVFIQSSEENKKENVSGLMFRTMAFLSTQLNCSEYKQLPSRKKLIEVLKANPSSIYKVLNDLEESQFILRGSKELDLIDNISHINPDQYNQDRENNMLKRKEYKGFKDSFKLNMWYGCNGQPQTIESISINELMDGVFGRNNEDIRSQLEKIRDMVNKTIENLT